MINNVVHRNWTDNFLWYKIIIIIIIIWFNEDSLIYSLVFGFCYKMKLKCLSYIQVLWSDSFPLNWISYIFIMLQTRQLLISKIHTCIVPIQFGRTFMFMFMDHSKCFIHSFIQNPEYKSKKIILIEFRLAEHQINQLTKIQFSSKFNKYFMLWKNLI